MIPQSLKERIRARAFEIYQYRQENQMFIITDKLGNPREITAEDDWIEAENEIVIKAKNEWR